MSHGTEDRRSSKRRYYKAVAICQMGSDGLGEMFTAQLLNISATGAQLMARRGPFAADAPLFLAIMNPRRQVIAEVRGSVRWSSDEAPGVCRFGVQFDKPLDDEQVAAIC